MIPSEIVTAFGSEESIVAWAMVTAHLATEEPSEGEWTDAVRMAPHRAYAALERAREELKREALEGERALVDGELPAWRGDRLEPYHFVLAQRTLIAAIDDDGNGFVTNS